MESVVPQPIALHPYIPDALLGSGGAARVYRVRGPDGSGPYALKVLLHPDPELRQRLRREFRVLAGLEHANLVRVHELLDLDGRMALRMACVEGPSLAEALRDGPPPHHVADGLASEVLGAMAVAHAAGVIHRDLKPANVLLDPVEGGLHARVVDFGLSRKNLVSDSLVTASGMRLGTTRYMAPEQLRHAGRGVDARADVWALGAVLQELLTGVPAFDGDDPVSLIDAIVAGRRRPLPQDTPHPWAHAIAAALSVDRDARPADAGALLDLWAVHRAAEVAGGPAWIAAAQARYRPQRLAGAAPAHHLPDREDTFVGRTVELQRIPERLLENRLLTVLGPGGVGKTRLSLEVGRRLIGAHAGGVWFCDLREARSAAGIAQVVARVLGIPLGFDAVGAVRDALARRGGLLLILDNFEQVVEHAEATVGAWFSAAPGLRVLTTSRVPLGLEDESTFRLGVLPLPETEAEHPEHSEAFALFVSRARRAFPGFEVDRDNAPAIARLVRALDGLPLAIEIAAARVRRSDLSRLEARLARRLHALPAPTSDASGHQRTLRATLDWSWALLSPPQRSALAQLSVFEGGASTAALTAVVRLDGATVEGAITGLRRASLVRLSEDDRIDLLVSVQAYAAEQARTRGLHAAASARHATFFADYGLLSSVSRLDGPDAPEHGARIYRELDNLVRACRWALERPEPTVAALCQLGAWGVLMDRGPFSLGYALSLRVRAMDLAGVDAETRARVWWVGGITSHYAGDMVEARESYRRSEQIMRTEGVEYMLSTLLNSQALEAVAVGDLERARAYLNEAIERHYARTGEYSGSLLGNLASIEMQLGRVEDAAGHLDTAVRLSRAHGDLHSEGVRCLVRAAVHRMRGEFDQAETRLRRSREVLTQVCNDVQLLAVMVAEGTLLRDRGETAAAEPILEEAGRRAVGVGKLLTAAEASLALAELSLLNGRAAEGLERAQRGRDLADEGDEYAAVARGCVLIARARIALGEPSEARVSLSTALADLDRAHRVWAADARLVSAELFALEGDLARASAQLATARARIEGWGMPPHAWLGQRLLETERAIAATHPAG